MCEVMVASSTTSSASRISWSRFFTWPGKRTSVCTIQNSVTVSGISAPFQVMRMRSDSSFSGPCSSTVSLEAGAFSDSIRRNSAAMRAASWCRLVSLLR